MKKTVTKKFMALLALVMLFTNLSSQTDGKKVFLDEVMKKSSYIFEGKVISSKSFKATNGGIYTSILVEVKDIINGTLQKGTIEIVREGGRIGEDEVTSSHKITIPKGDVMFFCSVADAGVNNSGVANSNSKSLEIQAVVGFSGNSITQSKAGIGSYFTQVTDVYDYLNKNYSISIDKSLEEKKIKKVMK